MTKVRIAYSHPRGRPGEPARGVGRWLLQFGREGAAPPREGNVRRAPIPRPRSEGRGLWRKDDRRTRPE